MDKLPGNVWINTLERLLHAIFYIVSIIACINEIIK